MQRATAAAWHNAYCFASWLLQVCLRHVCWWPVSLGEAPGLKGQEVHAAPGDRQRGNAPQGKMPSQAAGTVRHCCYAALVLAVLRVMHAGLDTNWEQYIMSGCLVFKDSDGTMYNAHILAWEQEGVMQSARPRRHMASLLL